MVRRNLIANYVGQGWVALMSVLFVPLYIKYVGIEAYGLIGLFAMLTAWLTILDMGLTPALGREMARFTGGGHTAESIRDLLRSTEIVVLGIALVVAAVIAAVSNWLSRSWIQVESLPEPVVSQAFSIMGLVIALRVIEGVYRSSLIGLQRQVSWNVINGLMATLRGLGAVGVLAWISPTIQAFFVWQGVISLATVAAFAIVTYSVLPTPNRPGRFSTDALLEVWRFAGGMIGIAILALLLTQADKILLSRLLTLNEYGYYALAAMVAGALYMFVAPVTQAWYPKLCELYVRDDQVGLVDAYHKGAQLVSVMAGSAAIVVILFAEPFLRLWTQDALLARRVAPLLSLLALGNLLHGLMWMPYQTQLAHGWTALSVRINIAAVLIIVPAIFWVTPRYGPEGAAWVWVGLNAGYVLIGVHFMYRRILSQQKWSWYTRDVLIPLVAGLAAATAVKTLAPEPGGDVERLTVLTTASVLTLAAASLSATHTRRQLMRFLPLRRQDH